MKIDNDTTILQISELMGSKADERDGRIMLGLLSRECVVDTDELSTEDWLVMIHEACAIRRLEEEE